VTETAVEPRELVKALRGASPSIDAFRRGLDALDPAGRIEAIRRLKGRDMAALFELAAGAAPLSPRDLVIGDGEPGTTYVWEGVNSLPAFRRFQKRFHLRAEGETELAGFNRQAMEPITGPGCFVARASDPDAPGALVFDYTRTPGYQPPGWPTVRPASKGLMSRLVYGFMHDYMRRVTDDIMVGRAYKHGRETSNYFVLLRGGTA
jgi:hypothetical protein